ncbi:DUF5947 family protein [Flexivirga alba]|uniref:DUF5947 family protein n=1 Tax=Flexivirga alba TaxID=702742 RepID=A0ABW2ALK9_9MICO
MSARSRPLGGLRRLSRPAPEPPKAEPPEAVEVCEMCNAEIDAGHGHVADLQAQRLLCTCRSCYLLFTGRGAGSGRYRALPEDSRRITDPTISQGQWDALQIPVDLAFFFLQTGAASYAACYPGPGGATESLLDLGSWDDVLRANPVLAEVEPDVEAVLIRRKGSAFQLYLVPIDACYELVGLVRQSWSGFSGGQEVWGRIETFFDQLDSLSRSVDRQGRRVVHA